MKKEATEKKDSNMNAKQKLIITSDVKSEGRKPTSQARGALHRLIVRFRKESENADNPGESTIFRAASDILASLARLFRSYEKNAENQDSS